MAKHKNLSIMTHQEKINFWKKEIEKLKISGRQYFISAWIVPSQLFGHIQKTAKHSVNVSDTFIENAVTLTDWHII